MVVSAEIPVAVTLRLIVRSKCSTLNGGYVANGSHDGLPVYVKEAEERHAQIFLFHESRFGGRFWYFGSNLPSGASIQAFIHSISDAASPEKASWPDNGVEAIENASLAHDHRRDAEALFHDPDFPHSSDSIGFMPACESITPQWIPVRFLARGQWKLFGEIEPSDLLQGTLGNCWLVAAVAAMAEFPDEVQKLFVDAEDISKDGQYTIRLYDHTMDRMRDIVIDEFVPCRPTSWWDPNGEPLFARPNGNKAWVLLLEKAMAKMLGSYSALDGNNPGFAFRALTGEKNTFMWKKHSTGIWTRLLLSESSTGFECDAKRSQEIDGDALFAPLTRYDTSKFLMTLSTNDHSMGHSREDGLIAGHAYSILEVVQQNNHKLICIRNPHGNGVQWNGAWSDGDQMWARFPMVRKDLRPEFKDDGIFWMSWGDFEARWDSVIVCAKSMRGNAAVSGLSHCHSSALRDLADSIHDGPQHPTPLKPLLLSAASNSRLDPSGHFRAHASPSEFPSKAASASKGDAASAPAEISCPGKHDLMPIEAIHEERYCELCCRLMTSGWSCLICNFDTCARCCSKACADASEKGKGKRCGHPHTVVKNGRKCQEIPCGEDVESQAFSADLRSNSTSHRQSGPRPCSHSATPMPPQRCLSRASGVCASTPTLPHLGLRQHAGGCTGLDAAEVNETSLSLESVDMPRSTSKVLKDLGVGVEVSELQSWRMRRTWHHEATESGFTGMKGAPALPPPRRGIRTPCTNASTPSLPPLRLRQQAGTNSGVDGAEFCENSFPSHASGVWRSTSEMLKASKVSELKSSKRRKPPLRLGHGGNSSSADGMRQANSEKLRESKVSDLKASRTRRTQLNDATVLGNGSTKGALPPPSRYRSRAGAHAFALTQPSWRVRPNASDNIGDDDTELSEDSFPSKAVGMPPSSSKTQKEPRLEAERVKLRSSGMRRTCICDVL